MYTKRGGAPGWPWRRGQARERERAAPTPPGTLAAAARTRAAALSGNSTPA